MEANPGEQETGQPNRVLRVLIGISFSIAAAIAVVMINLPPSDSAVQAMIEAAIVKLENSVRPTLPKKIDQLTSLVAIHHAGNTIQYEMTVDLSGTNAKPATAFATQIRAPIVKSICSSEMLQALKIGASFEYIYRDQNANDLGRFTVSKSDCQAA